VGWSSEVRADVVNTDFGKMNVSGVYAVQKPLSIEVEWRNNTM
jgi:hypothetical protein